MKKYLQNALFALLSLLFVASLTACGDDGPDNDIPSSAKEATRILPGTWYCVYKESEEDDSFYRHNYTFADNLYIRFDYDFTGTIHPTSGNSIFEIGRPEDFKWNVTKVAGRLYIETTADNVAWRIVELDDDDLTLERIEDNYRITARFERPDRD